MNIITTSLITKYINLQFNDEKIIQLSTFSFLFKQSNLLKIIDIDEDNIITIICSSAYILDENEMCLFDGKNDLSFMFTLIPNKFLEVCKFLDIICYENKDDQFSKQFIIYVMNNIKEEINVIKYFMQPEIRSIMNYLNKEDINLQIISCTPIFYGLYLNNYDEYNEYVIKYNRMDIFNEMLNKKEYYRYIHKYDNHLTYIVKETQEYKNHIIKISNKLIEECNKSNNIKNIMYFVEQGANVNIQNNYGRTALHTASCLEKNLEVIKYLVEQGADVNLQSNYGETALHYASKLSNNLEVIKYLVEQGANINLQTNNGSTALHYASALSNNSEGIKFMVEQGANINQQDNYGYTSFHIASHKANNLEVINYLVEHGADIHLQCNYDDYAFIAYYII